MRTGPSFLRSALVALCIAPLNPWSTGIGVQGVMAETYYVAPNGDDDLGLQNPGTNSTAPWSLVRLQAAINNGLFGAGDQILFFGTEATPYEGKLVIHDVQGTEMDPVVFAAAPGNTPVFSGSIGLTGWDNVTTDDVNDGLSPDALGHAFKTTVFPTNTTDVIDLFHKHIGSGVDTELRFRLKTRARYPDVGVFNHANPGSAVTGGSFVDDNLTDVPHNGAIIVLRYQSWGYARSVVTGHNTTTNQLTYGTIPTQDPQSGDWGYYLEGLKQDLDQEGEWAYDSGTLYYWPPGGQQPPDGEVRACVADGNGSAPGQLIIIGGDDLAVTGVTLRGLLFEQVCSSNYLAQTYGVAVRMRSGPHRFVKVENCHFRDLTHGIVEYNEYPTGLPRDCFYRANLFERIHGMGIATESERVTIDENIFRDVNLEPGHTGPGFADATAIVSSGNDAIVRNNLIQRAGGSGITVGGEDDPDLVGELVVENNRVIDYSRILNDHAGITFDRVDGLQVRNNIVTDAVGSVTSSATNGGFQDDKTVGIYFGNTRIRNTTVTSNTITGVGNGIAVDHEPLGIDTTDPNNQFPVGMQGNRITDNTVFGTRGAQLSMLSRGRFTSAYQQNFDDLVSGNILYSLRRDQWPLWLFQIEATSWNGTSRPRVDFGTYSGNYCFNPFNPVTHYMEFNSDAYQTTGLYLTDVERPRIIPFTMAGWNSLVEPSDVSFTSPLHLKDYEVTSSAPVAFHSTDCTAADNTWSNAAAGTGQGASDGHFKRFTDQLYCERWALAASSATVIDPGSAPTPASTTYRFTLRARSNTADAIRIAPLVNTASAVVDPSYYIQLKEDWLEQEVILFVPDAPEVDRFAISLGNAQYGMAALPVGGGNLVDIDHVRTDIVTLDPAYYTNEVLPNHILRYNCPLQEPGDQNIHDPSVGEGEPSEFIITGPTTDCWSDVYGNFYQGGTGSDPITLDEWASIVLFKFNVADANLALNGSGEYRITQGNDELWTENHNVAGSIVVENGATLTIDGAHIGFAESTPSLTTNLVVEPGGTLIVRNGGTLRNWMGCGAAAGMWDGVKAFGVDYAYDMDPAQGRVFLESGARITNAHCGILAGFGDPTNPGFVGFDDVNFWVGGSVVAHNAAFENNVYDVVMHPGGWPAVVPYDPLEMDNYQGLTRFKDCTFRTTRELNDPALYPKAHVRLTDRDASAFMGCTFVNERTDIPSLTSAQLGHGVELFNSGFTVTTNLPYGTGTNTAPNVFRNLDHGVHSTTSNGNVYSIVSNCTFTDNVCAVFISGEAGLAITDNDIKLGRWSGITMDGDEDESFDDHQRGIFTTKSWGLAIQNNRLAASPDAPASAPTEGIVVGYTADHNDVVSENRCTGLERGFIGEGICADVDGANENIIGLQLLCNLNTGNATNLMSRKAQGDVTYAAWHTIRGIQGDPTSTPTTTSAGNRFDQSTTYDYYTNTTRVPQIVYLYDPSGDQEEPVNLSTLPGSEVVPATSGGAACEGGAPGIIGGGHTISSLKPLLQSNKYAYGTIRYLYEQLIDGGNTDEVVQEIITTWPQDVWQLRTYLLNLSPYLSVEALQQLVDKEGVPVAIKAEICVANPEATQKDGFIKWAEYDANYPLPAYAIASIRASWDVKTYRFTLEAQMAEKHTNMTQAVNHLLYLYRTDSAHADPDSLRWVWQQLRTNAARYAEAGLLMGQGRLSEARAVLVAMPSEKGQMPAEEVERQRMLDYVDLFIVAKNDGRNAYRLVGQEVDDLETLVGVEYDRPAVWGSNLLCAIYGRCRAPYTGGIVEPKSLRATSDEPIPSGTVTGLQVQPNPASTWVAFNYQVPDNTGLLQLRVRDAGGRVVHSLQAAGTVGQQVWDTRNAAPGVYSVELLREGRSIHTERLVIQP